MIIKPRDQQSLGLLALNTSKTASHGAKIKVFNKLVISIKDWALLKLFIVFGIGVV